MNNIVKDENGNMLLAYNDGKSILISLKLREETRYRDLGTIDISNRIIKMVRDSKKHIMRKISGYGFNHKLLFDAKTFDKINLKDENSTWSIPKSYILENGSFLHFKEQGFERQIFISLKEIEKFKV